MPRYRVLQNYQSNLTWVDEGDEVEMTADTAAFVERDSPGTLEEIGPGEPEPEMMDRYIPGEGDKDTPASGVRPPVIEPVRIVRQD